MNLNNALTVAQVAQELSVTVARVHAMRQAGKFPSAIQTADKRWLIDRRDLDRPEVRDRKAGNPHSKRK
jgi:hypothetical protein